MADEDWRGVGRRIGQIAGLLAFLLAILRLGRLIEAERDQRWQVVLIAAALLGGVAWWLLDQVIRNATLKVSLMSVGGVLLALRVAVPDQLQGGFLPTAGAAEAIGVQLERALYLIQYASPPVDLLPGISAILALLMWSVGALYGWGSTRGPNAAMFLPSMVIYFQFAVFDRASAGLGWLAASVLVLSLSVLSVAFQQRENSGRARDSEGRPVARRTVSAGIAIVAILAISSLALANTASTVISEYGNKWWSSGGGGFGAGGSGGVSFDGLVDLRQRVISRSNNPVFQARVNGDVPPLDQIFWRMETLDVFDGEQWERSSRQTTSYRTGEAVPGSLTYWGTTHQFLEQVQIEDLRGSLAPTAGMPVEIQRPTGAGPEARIPSEFYVLPDASIATSSPLGEGDTYQLSSVMADYRADFGMLATGEDGQFTPMFANAAETGDFPYTATQASFAAVAPPNLGSYVELPTDTPSALGSLAAVQTRGARSDFERAWLLQAFFRETGGFVYDDEVSTGHSSLILADWLTEPESLNYRTGYCEQFAAGMGVLLRELQIPARVVWGFTPGEVSTVTDDQGDTFDLITVRDTNAHAWVEAWIEPVGWVAFDPTPRSDQTSFDFQPESVTAGFDPRAYVDELEVTAPSIPAPDGGPGFIEIEPEAATGSSNPLGSTPRWWLIGLVALMPLLGLVPFAKRMRRRRRLRRIREGDITAAWDEIVDRLVDLGEPVPVSHTPIELARTTDSALLPLALSYSASVYGAREGQAKESDLIAVEWWLERTFDGRRRIKAALNPKSLRRSRL